MTKVFFMRLWSLIQRWWWWRSGTDFNMGTDQPLTTLIISLSSHMVFVSAAAVHPQSPPTTVTIPPPPPLGFDPLYLSAHWEQQSFREVTSQTYMQVQQQHMAAMTPEISKPAHATHIRALVGGWGLLNLNPVANEECTGS